MLGPGQITAPQVELSVKVPPWVAHALESDCAHVVSIEQHAPVTATEPSSPPSTMSAPPPPHAALTNAVVSTNITINRNARGNFFGMIGTLLQEGRAGEACNEIATLVRWQHVLLWQLCRRRS